MPAGVLQLLLQLADLGLELRRDARDLALTLGDLFGQPALLTGEAARLTAQRLLLRLQATDLFRQSCDLGSERRAGPVSAAASVRCRRRPASTGHDRRLRVRGRHFRGVRCLRGRKLRSRRGFLAGRRLHRRRLLASRLLDYRRRPLYGRLSGGRRRRQIGLTRVGGGGGASTATSTTSCLRPSPASPPSAFHRHRCRHRLVGSRIDLDVDLGRQALRSESAGRGAAQRSHPPSGRETRPRHSPRQPRGRASTRLRVEFAIDAYRPSHGYGVQAR